MGLDRKRLSANAFPHISNGQFCLAKARECRYRAERATVPSRRKSWMEMKGVWFDLARSYDNERRTDRVLRVSTKT